LRVSVDLSILNDRHPTLRVELSIGRLTKPALWRSVCCGGLFNLADLHLSIGLAARFYTLSAQMGDGAHSDDGSLLYTEAAFLVCIALGGSCRVKTALYENDFTTDLRKLYALVCKSLDSYKLLSETVVHANFLHAQATEHLTNNTLSADSSGCSVCTLAVLAHDLLLGSGRSKHHLLTRQLYQATADPRAVQKLRRSFREIMKLRKGSIGEEVPQPCKFLLSCLLLVIFDN
ncbi:hypothetical protein PHET_11481, partial [Paragonimus heterotremus]